jgi:hypothetical protein
MATNSLPQLIFDEFQPISRSAIFILARLAAKKIVTEQLREASIRVSLVVPATITAKANQYLAAHPELYVEAMDRAKRLGMYEKPRRAKVTSAAQKESGQYQSLPMCRTHAQNERRADLLRADRATHLRLHQEQI